MHERRSVKGVTHGLLAALAANFVVAGMALRLLRGPLVAVFLTLFFATLPILTLWKRMVDVADLMRRETEAPSGLFKLEENQSTNTQLNLLGS